MPAVIDSCLAVADELDFQVQLHTDTLNESGFLEDTLAAINGRTIHMYHTEGAGGGHAPGHHPRGRRAELPAVLDQSDQSLHGQHLRRTSRHDDGVPSPQSGDSGGRGVRRKPHPRADHRRRGRAARHRRDLDARLRQPGHGPHPRGDLPDLAAGLQDEGPARAACRRRRPGFGDNERIKRYIAKYTINAARTFGIDAHIGSLENGKMADIVLWRPAFFGIKPELVIKGGFIAWGAMGDSAASLMTCEPMLPCARNGARSACAKQALCACFVNPHGDRARSRRQARAARKRCCRRGARASSTRRDMLHNDACPNITRRSADLRRVTSTASSRPASRRRVLPLAQTVHAAMSDATE